MIIDFAHPRIKALRGRGLRDAFILLYVIVGLVLPLDFLYQIDGYRMYLRPAGIAQVFAYATVVYFLLGLIVVALSIGAISALAALSGRSAKPIVRMVGGGIGAAIGILVLLRNLKFWLLNLNLAPPIPMSGHTWWLMLVLGGLFMFVMYKNATLFNKMAQWMVFNTTLFALLTGVTAAAHGLYPLIGQGEPQDTANTANETIQASPRPRIILITMDSFLARHSPVYGYERETTPALSQFARGGSVFSSFYSNGNFTPSGIRSLLYGVRPWTHRIYAPVYVVGDAISAQFSLFAQLKKNGYTTLAATSNPHTSPALNLTAPYLDASVDCAIRWMVVSCLTLNSLAPEAMPIMDLESVRYVGNAIERAMTFFGIWTSADQNDPELVFSQARRMLMEQQHQAPLALWVHLFTPHAPYASPAPFVGRFDASMRRRSRFDSSPPSFFAGATDPDFPDGYVGRYDEALLYGDDHVGRFLNWLKDNQLYDDSLIVVTADHGESFSHGYGGHGGALLHNDVIHIPLIIKEPHQRSGQRLDSTAEQIDLTPTILDLANIKPEGNLEGKSLKPILRGEVQQFDRPVFSMTFEMNSRFGPLRTGTVSMIDSNWKYTSYRGYRTSASLPLLLDELFDLSVDPSERNNMIDERPDLAARMKAEVDRQLQSH
jgi:arylsulfatase A-like enzyme